MRFRLGIARNVAIAVTMLAGLCLLCPPAQAAGRSQKEPRNELILWKVTKDDSTRPSYILGTMHMLPRDQLAAIKKALGPYIRHTDTLVVESDILEIEELAETRARYRDGTKLSDVLGRELGRRKGAELFDRIVDIFRAQQMPQGDSRGDAVDLAIRQSLESFRPWALLLQLTMPEGEFMDLSLAAMTLTGGRVVKTLETPAEQLAAFTGLAQKDQITLLGNAVQGVETGATRRTNEKMNAAYVAGDRPAWEAMLATKESSPADHALAQRLKTKRDPRLARRTRAHLDQGRALVAMGLGHLLGEGNVLERLERAGYSVTPVPLKLKLQPRQRFKGAKTGTRSRERRPRGR